MFGRRVGQDSGGGDDGGRGGEVDDGAAGGAPGGGDREVFLGAHSDGGLTGYEERAGGVDVEKTLEFGEREVGDVAGFLDADLRSEARVSCGWDGCGYGWWSLTPAQLMQ